MSLGQYADSSNDEGFIHVGQPLRRRFARGGVVVESAKLHLTGGISIVRRLRTPFGGIDEREAISNPFTEFAVAGVGLF